MSIPPRDNVNHAEGRDRSSENHHENTSKIAGSFSHSDYRAARDNHITSAGHGAATYMPPGEVRQAGLNFHASNPDSIAAMMHRELGAHQQLGQLLNHVERMGNSGQGGGSDHQGRTQHQYEAVPQAGDHNPRHGDPNQRAAALVAHAERTGRHVGTVGECAKGVRLALEKVGLHFQAPNATSFGRQLEQSGHFQRMDIPLHQAQPGDVIVRNWNHDVQRAHNGKNNGDVVVVTGQNRDGSLRGANDHIVHQIPADGGRYRNSYVLRMTGAGDTQTADNGHAPAAPGSNERQQYAQTDNGSGSGSDQRPPASRASYTSDGEIQAQWHARGTGYYPANNRMEGGFTDRKGHQLHTLQDFLEHPDKTPYVSVAMDSKAARYGTSLHIPELDNKYRDQLNAMGVDHIPFRVVDTGGAFRGRGTSRVDICTRNSHAAVDSTINGPLTLQVTNDGGHDINPNYRYASRDPGDSTPHARRASYEQSGGGSAGGGHRQHGSHSDSHAGGGHSGHSSHSGHGRHAFHGDGGGHSRGGSRSDAGHSSRSFSAQPHLVGYDENGNPIYEMPDVSPYQGPDAGSGKNPDGSPRQPDGQQQPGQDGSTPQSGGRGPGQDGSTPRQDGSTRQQDAPARQPDGTARQHDGTARPGQDVAPSAGPARQGQGDAPHGAQDRTNPSYDKPAAGQDTGGHTRAPEDWHSFYRSQTRNNNCLPTSMSMMYADWRKGAPASDGELRQIERITHVGSHGGYEGSANDIAQQAKTVVPGLHTQSYEGMDRKTLAQTLDHHLEQGHSAIVGIKSPYSSGNHYIYVAGKDSHGNYMIGDSGRHGGGLLGKTIAPGDLVNRMMARNGGSRMVAGWLEDSEGNVAHR